jgi:hypothetical protein
MDTIIKEWSSPVTVTPSEAMRKERYFNPVAHQLKSLAERGTAFLTEQNQHGEGYYANLRIRDGNLTVEYCRSGGESMDYGVEQLALALGRILNGQDPGLLHFNSCVH